MRCIGPVVFRRVSGEFPSGEVRMDAPILCTSRQKGAHTVNESGKPAQTVFRRVSHCHCRLRCSISAVITAADSHYPPAVASHGVLLHGMLCCS